MNSFPIDDQLILMAVNVCHEAPLNPQEQGYPLIVRVIISILICYAIFIVWQLRED